MSPLFTFIVGVVSPVLHTKVKGPVPPVVVAVKVTLLPEHIVVEDADILTFNVHDWLYTRNDNNKNTHISIRFFINLDRSFLMRYIFNDLPGSISAIMNSIVNVECKNTYFT